MGKSIPITIQIGSEQHVVNMRMDIRVELDRSAPDGYSARIVGDGLARALVDKDLPGFLRLLAQAVELDQGVGS